MQRQEQPAAIVRQMDSVFHQQYPWGLPFVEQRRECEAIRYRLTDQGERGGCRFWNWLVQSKHIRSDGQTTGFRSADFHPLAKEEMKVYASYFEKVDLQPAITFLKVDSYHPRDGVSVSFERIVSASGVTSLHIQVAENGATFRYDLNPEGKIADIRLRQKASGSDKEKELPVSVTVEAQSYVDKTLKPWVEQAIDQVSALPCANVLLHPETIDLALPDTAYTDVEPAANLQASFVAPSTLAKYNL